MRWQLILQTALGVGALFGIAYIAVDQKVAPLVEASSKARAEAQARAAALEVELAFVRSRRGLERAAHALSKSPVFADLGASIPADRRSSTLTSALEAAVDQVGGEGRAALFDSRGAAIAGAAALGETDAVRDARTGVASLRVESLDDASFEVVALPVGPSDGSVLVLARPLGRARLAAWTRRLPLSTEVAMFDGAEPVADLLAPGTLDAVRVNPLPPVVEVGDGKRAVATLELADDGRAGLRVVTLAPIEDVTQSSIMTMLQLLVLGLGALSFGLFVVLSSFADRAEAAPTPAPARAPELVPAEVATDTDAFPTFQNSPPSPAVSQGAYAPNALSGSVSAARPDALGTYSGVPTARSETFPSMGEDIDATPHSELEGRPAGSDWSSSASPNPVFGGAPLPPLADLGRPTLAPISTTDAAPFASRPEGPGALEPNAQTPPLRADAPPPPQSPPTPVESMRPVPVTPERETPRPPTPPPPSSPQQHRPSFDAIARAAHSAPPMPRPESDEENLPVPKGGLSPGMIAGQSLASHGHVMAPSKRHEEDLPLPKEQASHLYDLGPAPATTADANGIEPRRAGPRGSPGLTGGAPSASGFTTPASPMGSGVTAPRDPTPPVPPAPPAPPIPPPGPAKPPAPAAAPPSPPMAPNPPDPSAGGGSPDPRPFDMEHYRRVYDEFVSAKERLGESVEGLSFEGFGAKLKASEESLIDRHGCRAVRFQVLVKDHAVSLRPQLVR